MAPPTRERRARPKGDRVRTTLNTYVSLGLNTLRTAALCTLLTAAVGYGVAVPLTSNGPTTEVPAAQGIDPHVQSLMTRYRCSTTGFGAGTIPASALIRTERGRVRMVSFDRGWAIHTGDRPGTLMAVCLGELPAARGR